MGNMIFAIGKQATPPTSSTEKPQPGYKVPWALNSKQLLTDIRKVNGYKDLGAPCGRTKIVQESLQAIENKWFALVILTGLN